MFVFVCQKRWFVAKNDRLFTKMIACLPKMTVCLPKWFFVNNNYFLAKNCQKHLPKTIVCSQKSCWNGSFVTKNDRSFAKNDLLSKTIVFVKKKLPKTFAKNEKMTIGLPKTIVFANKVAKNDRSLSKKLPKTFAKNDRFLPKNVNVIVIVIVIVIVMSLSTSVSKTFTKKVAKNNRSLLKKLPKTLAKNKKMTCLPKTIVFCPKSCQKRSFFAKKRCRNVCQKRSILQKNTCQKRSFFAKNVCQKWKNDLFAKNDRFLQKNAKTFAENDLFTKKRCQKDRFLQKKLCQNCRKCLPSFQ